MDKLTRDLVTEYSDKGIIVQSVLPGYVATNMSRIRISSYTAPSSTEFTKVALKTIGLQTRTAAYPPHRVMVCNARIDNDFRSFCPTLKYQRNQMLCFLFHLFAVIWNQLGTIFPTELPCSSFIPNHSSNVAESKEESSKTS
jgi:hypothetical protein